jgi:hypothetical protein
MSTGNAMKSERAALIVPKNCTHLMFAVRKLPEAGFVRGFVDLSNDVQADGIVAALRSEKGFEIALFRVLTLDNNSEME